MTLQYARALIVGAGSGLSASIARCFAREGLAIALAARDTRALVVDWHGASEGQRWLRDNVHPNSDGQAALGALIADHLACGCVP
jgi:NAD(P)-dependent dehydrogenase (short-subunit alcohol dehydrogenase family)